MKRLLAIAIIATVACVITTNAFAASANIAITATVSGTQGVSLSGTSWGIDAIDTADYRDSASITATNNGSVTETLKMSAVTAGDFTLGSDAGADQIAIWGKCASSDPTLTNANALTGDAGQTSANVDPAASLTVYMKYKSPSTITGTKSVGAATVTVSTASAT